MFVLVGLGNPGNQYALNRHNVGFMAIDTIAESYGFPPFKQKFSALVSEGNLGTNRLILCKPQTFMNRSGQSVAQLVQFYKVLSHFVYVIHDDLALEPGRVKLKLGGGAGGHNGLRSLDQHMGANYWRVRVGIGHPGVKDMVSDYVLSNFKTSDHDWLTSVLSSICEESPSLLGGDPSTWIQALEKRMAV
jgi:PTH1 family peptidyl-tRNA hydrolase